MSNDKPDSGYDHFHESGRKVNSTKSLPWTKAGDGLNGTAPKGNDPNPKYPHVKPVGS